MLDVIVRLPSLLLLVGGLLLAAVAYVAWRRQVARGTERDVFRALGTDAKSALRRFALPPVDLSKPIAGDAHWRAIRAHARDAAYQLAVDSVRNRYRFVGNPMLLSNTLQETMTRYGLPFREAMLRVAEDDGLGHR
jgi:hypothetical protein